MRARIHIVTGKVTAECQGLEQSWEWWINKLLHKRKTVKMFGYRYKSACDSHTVHCKSFTLLCLWERVQGNYHSISGLEINNSFPIKVDIYVNASCSP